MSTHGESTITIDFEGKAIEARATDTVAAALLRDGTLTFSRGPKYHRPRGPFCLTGNCAQCHMRVGDEPNVPTCTTPVRRALHVERQNVLGTGDLDLLRAVDFLYPEGIDHHHLMTRFKLLNEATKMVARRLAGIGVVPSVPFKGLKVKVVRSPLVIVGAGPAGLSVALEAIERGLTPLVLDARDIAGGHVAAGLQRPGDPTAEEVAAWAERVENSGTIELGAHVTGLFSEAGRHYLIAVVDDTFWEIEADRVVIACGGQERNLVFEANDLPGVFSGRGLLRLATEHGVLPGRRVAVVAAHADASAVIDALRRAGAEIVAIVDVHGTVPEHRKTLRLTGSPVAALGRHAVTGLRVRTTDRSEEDIDCDVIAVVAPPVPCYELAAEVGASTRYSDRTEGFVIVTDDAGRTNIDWLFAAGSVTGTDLAPAESRPAHRHRARECPSWHRSPALPSFDARPVTKTSAPLSV